MNPGPTEQTQQTIIDLAHAFDGYAYAEQHWHAEGTSHGTLLKHLQQMQESNRFFLNPDANFAINFYIHRSFRHQGFLPELRSSHWYDMALLYLHLYRVPISQSCRHIEFYKSWAHRQKGTAESAAAELRELLRRG